MFTRKNDEMCKVALIVAGAVVAVGGVVFGLTKLKKRKSVEKECGEGCCCDTEEIECVDEQVRSSEETPLLTEEEIKALQSNITE